MKRKELPLFHNAPAKKVLSDACKANGIKLELLRDLLEIQREFTGSARQNGITNAFDACLNTYVDQEREEE
jgi:hypothetical protein